MIELLLAVGAALQADTAQLATARTMYEVSYHIPGTGIEHALRFEHSEDCEIVRVMIENIRIAQPEVVVRECRPVVVAP